MDRSFFAINRLGAMAMLINAALSAEEIRKVRACGDVRFLLSDVQGCDDSGLGENVMPEEVVDALMACSGVADARVFGEPDEFWGETELAAVVPADGFVLDERRLAAELECRLAKFKRPSRFVLLESFPLLVNGKVDMVALKRLCLTIPHES